MSQTIADALTGAHIIDGRDVPGGGPRFAARNPRTGEAGAIGFAEATVADVAAAAAVAADTFRAWSRTPARERARVLRAIAHALEARRASIVETADAETGLGPVRLNGELDRTTGQLALFADLLEEGSYVEATISTGDPRAPVPRPDVRRLLVPIGPVGVITPSNFPLAFGLLGGDTVSALAAGCPVIVKGHPSHPATSERCARAWLAAARATGAPTGLLALLQARGLDAPTALARAPELQAIGFTGSLRAGRALADLAAARPRPIPVYAEMGSLNPLFIGEAALAARAEAIAGGLAISITQGTGQFCTKPGLVFVPDTPAGAEFARLLAARVAARDTGVLLNRGIHTHLRDQLASTLSLPGVDLLTPLPSPFPPPRPAGATAATSRTASGATDASDSSRATAAPSASHPIDASAATPATAAGPQTDAATGTRSDAAAHAAAADADADAQDPSGPLTFAGAVATVSADDFLSTPTLSDEHFGPFAIVIRCAPARMAALAAGLDGSLTATLHADPDDADWAAALADVLADKAGRLIWNGYPTGVAVVSAMHHGGPYPGTSNPLHTSVGTAAIRRFLRPVAYQDTPDAWLPSALRNANPDGLQRLVDGRWTRDPLSA